MSDDERDQVTPTEKDEEDDLEVDAADAEAIRGGAKTQVQYQPQKPDGSLGP
jgi:hypothetical protein